MRRLVERPARDRHSDSSGDTTRGARRRPSAPPTRTATGFAPDLFRFLRELKRHNDRRWFQARKARYERDVRDPMLRFIAAAAAPLRRISPCVVADPRPSGGSMFRIYRDVRFAKNKDPYKTHVAAHFRHAAARDVHAPGFYLHLEPNDVFFGAGIWRPDPETLYAIRRAIVENDALWRKLTTHRGFRAICRIDGDSVARVPPGFDPEHPLKDDIRLKDFTVIAEVAKTAALRSSFLDRFVRFCRITASLNEFLARALGLDW
ncbi:MAG: DUF2461 domain-containing protein [Vicinamibacteria bacterium]|nr:DUF2461 domain-containing protein [Vicinamibacteria bacterium]